MKTNLNAILSASRKGPDAWLMPRIECVDGFTVSVQASKGHYCSPRNDLGPWTQVELGFPSAMPTRAVKAYAEDKKTPLDTVYGFVPIELVEKMLDKHGGIKP